MQIGLAQFWYWFNNIEIVSNKKVLNEKADKLFRQIYKDESISEGRIEFDFVKKIIKDKKLDEDKMKEYMPEALVVLKLMRHINVLKTTTERKNELIKKLLDMPFSKINILDMISNTKYKTLDIIDLITTYTTDISASTSGKQYEEIDQFLTYASELFEDNLVYESVKNYIKNGYDLYIGVHTLYANNPDITSKDIIEFFDSNKLVNDNLLWGLKALKTLKIKKNLKLNDIIKIFEAKKMYSSTENKCQFVLINILKEIKRNPERFYLSNDILKYFYEKYDIDKIIGEEKELDKSKPVDLSKYSIIISNPEPEDDISILTPEEELYIKEKFTFDTCKKILYILNNPEEARKNKEELIISINKNDIDEFIEFINNKLGMFFSYDYKVIYDMYKEFHQVIENKEDLDDYLLKNLSMKNLDLYLRWLLIETPLLENKYEFSDLIFLIHRKKGFILSVDELEVALKNISKNEDSYLYGKKLIKYVKDMYGYDVKDETKHLSDYIFKSRKIDHLTTVSPKNIDLVEKASTAYMSLSSKKYDLEDILIFALNYEYHDEENDKYYNLSKDEVKSVVKKIAKEKYEKEVDDIHSLIENFISIRQSRIKSLLMNTKSFKEILVILELKKKLKGEKGSFSEDDIKEFDKYIRDNKFYSETNYYSLMKFYEKIKYESNKYAYSKELVAYYEEFILRKNNKTDEIAPNIELVNKKDDEDTLGYKIINRIIPTSSEEKKRSLTAVISGIGVISLLTMTTVLAISPISAIESCASSFAGLLSHPSLSGLIHTIGNPLLYFGAIYESIRGFSKHRFKNAIENIKDESNGRHI